MSAQAPADFYERLFLNPPRHHAGAYILAEVATEANDAGDGERRWVTSTLRIADCNRVIELDFPVGDEGSRKASMFKLDLLIETLSGFRAALVAGCEWADAPREEPAPAAQ